MTTARTEPPSVLLRWARVFAGLSLLFAGCETASTGPEATRRHELVLTAPASRLVYQRGLDGTALIPIAGYSPWPDSVLEARLSPSDPSAEPPAWQPLGRADTSGRFHHRLRVAAGWYRLEVRVQGSHGPPAAVDRVGVGEVFIVVGHSVAQGGNTHLAGAKDDRVNTIAWPPDSADQRREYERTADPRLLPPLLGAPYADDVSPAPFGNGAYFWARFAEYIAQRQDVPVLLLNAAFGGTSLEHWAKSARGESFEHGFVRAGIRMPYINLHHALRQYAAHTGVRALLADQGQNDWPEPDTSRVFAHYLAFVTQARADLDCAELAVVVNRQTPPGDRTQIRLAQERMLREVPHTFPGPDYDTLAEADRYDGIHLSTTGLSQAARLWADALTPAFFQQVRPCLPAQ